MHNRVVRRIQSAFLVLVLVSASLGCPLRGRIPVQVVESGAEATFVPKWAPLFDGIDVTTVRKEAPEPLRLYALRVDLDDPDIEFFVTPSNGDRPLDTDAQIASGFLTEHGCQVAVNASPFSPVNDEPGSPRDVVGLSASDGDVYSPPHDSFGVFFVDAENNATVTAPPIDTGLVWNGVGGFGMLIVDGVIVAGDGDRHPRTAVGTSEDGRYLYFLIIDGRQPHVSVGSSLKETAEWMARVGAHRALNLDGGGSTALVIEGPRGLPKILNRPIHNNMPGRQRLNGNHLGIYTDR
ncbi:MAG: hypothetical protein GY851_10225 [bacterium]|nr:hypothetical protein [bacterium]